MIPSLCNFGIPISVYFGSFIGDHGSMHPLSDSCSAMFGNLSCPSGTGWFSVWVFDACLMFIAAYSSVVAIDVFWGSTAFSHGRLPPFISIIFDGMSSTMLNEEMNKHLAH